MLHYGVSPQITPPSFICDTCDRKIIQSHILSLTCMEDRFVSTVDFCIGCRAKSCLEELTTTHIHSLIRGDFLPHNYQLSWLIPKARMMSKQIKAEFHACSQVPQGRQHS